ncbi:MAG: PD-(D/E)XK nuclease-like domain-containing protein [Candidatus Caccovivens sp.]
MIKKLSIKKYHEAEGLSKSMMDKLARSPAHLKAYMEEPEKETEAMILGSLFHTLVLEPKKLDKEFAILPELDRRTTAGKLEYAYFCEANEGKTIITREQFEQAMKWVDAVRNNPEAKKWLTGKGKNEVSIFWKDERTGEICKARPDRIKDGYIIDLKTAVSAQQDDFQRKAYDLGYYRQDAWFREAYRQEFKTEAQGFLFIVVEKTAPFSVMIYQFDTFAIEIAEIENRRLLDTYHKCKETGNWYGYDGEKPEIQTLGLPNYVIAKNMEEL